MAEIRVIEVKESVFANNDARAQLLREELKQEKTFRSIIRPRLPFPRM